MSVALPRVMSPQGVFLRTIQPIKATLELSITPLSTASLQLPEDETLPARGWVEMFTEMGSAGIFRVRSPQNSYGDDISISELEHAVVEVGDYLVKHNYSEMMAANAAVTALFGYYGGSRWQLGSTAALGTSQVAVQVNYDNVLQAILGVLDQVPECMMTFDFSTSPWTMNFAARDTTVSAEGRLSRNVESAKITYDDSELCTKVYYETESTDAEGVPSSEWHYLQADAETISKYGIVEREVLTGDSFTAEEGLYVATRFLSRHKKPVLSIEISAEDLSQITGEAFDTFRIGKMLRLALPDYDASEEQTITAMIWDDIYGNPRSVTVQLAEEEDSTVTFLHDMSSDSIGAMGGGGGGGSGKKKQDDAFKAYRTNFERTDYYIDMNAQHIREDGSILQQAGMYLDSNGVLIYAEDNERNLGAKLRVQADQIGMTIGSINYNAANLRTYATRAAFPATGQAGLFYKDNSTGQMYVWQNGTYERCSLSTDGKRVNTIHAGEIALAINESGEVEANIDAEKVNISATNSFYSLAGELERDANGNLVIKSAGGMRVRKTQSGVTSEFGVYDENNLTGGIVVQKINDGTTTSHIIGDRIVVGDDIEGTVLPDWIDINDGLIAQKATIVDLNAVKARVSTLEADSITTQNMSSVAAEFYSLDTGNATMGSVDCTDLEADGAVSADIVYAGSFVDNNYNEFEIYDAAVSGNTLTIYKTNGNHVTFSKAATLSVEYGGDNTGDTATFRVTGTPAQNFPSGNSVMGTFKVHQSKAAAYITDYFGTIRARIDNPQYGNGWAAAYGNVSLPTSSSTASSFSVSTPKSTTDGGANTETYTLSNPMNDVAVVKNSAGTIVARFEHGKYTAGVTEGESHFTAHADITPISSTSIRVGSAITNSFISGNGVTPSKKSRKIASANGTDYLRYQSALTLSPYNSGNSITLYYKSGNYYYTAGTHGWYYTNSGGTSYYKSAGTQTHYDISDEDFYDVGSSYKDTTLYKAAAAETYYPALSSGGTVYYTAGTKVTGLYTKNS